MRKNPTPDADPADRKPADAAAPGTPLSADAGPVQPADDAGPARSGDDSTAPSLVWPPVDEELNGWEVLHFQSSGQTIIEPMKFTPPGAPAPDASGEPTATPPPYAPPAPIDDPAGDTSLLPLTSDFDLPQTELIEPLTLLPEAPAPGAAAPASARPAAPDDRTVVIPRPAAFSFPHKSDPAPASGVREPAPALPRDDTNPGTATRILVAPAFAASVGHAPTVPVSALHRAAERPQPAFGPRHPMEETLPAGVTRELLAGGAHGDTATVHGDDTVTRFIAHGDTHPASPPLARRAPAGPSGPPSPFSRVPSRAPQPAVDGDAAPEPAPISLAAPPLAFGPRVPASSAPTAAPPPGIATAPTGPVPAIAAAGLRDARIPTRPAPTSTRAKLLSMAGALVVVLLLALGAYQVLSMRSTAAAGPAMATLAVESSPTGATVVVDGTPRGTTPLRLELAEGNHALDVSHAGATRHVPLALAAGTITAHSFEFAAASPAAAADAAIEIRSEPAGGRVLVDGVARGTTPIVVTGLTAGRHEVQVGGPFRTVTRTVNLAAKQQALLVVTPARPPATSEADSPRTTRAAAGTGFIAIESPIVLRVVRNGDFVGTSEDARLQLPVGPQVIGLENESVGFRDVRTVEVVAGKVTPVPVTLPKGEISINARPWAEVFVDGNRIGETPVSQLSLPVGIHEITFRHPEHGERRVSVVVKIGATGRAFTDFTK